MQQFQSVDAIEPPRAHASGSAVVREAGIRSAENSGHQLRAKVGLDTICRFRLLFSRNCWNATFSRRDAFHGTVPAAPVSNTASSGRVQSTQVIRI